MKKNMGSLKDFDPNGASSPNSGLFGLPCSEQESKMIFIAVPWEVTTSYGGGTSKGPAALLQASKQVDLYDRELGNFWQQGLFMRPISKKIEAMNKSGKALAAPIIKAGGVGKSAKLKKALTRVNATSRSINDWVYKETLNILEQDKIPVIVGGDHSVPFGAIKACADTTGEFGILHFDAHSDTRNAYEGFEHSHASIMYNVLENIPQVTSLVQVGIRDFCQEEAVYVSSQDTRVSVFYDEELFNRKAHGETWHGISQDIINKLPTKVWISFDIDGLDPRFCPHTGTPVPGGLDFREAVSIIRAVVESGRTIIGFDLNEVAPGPKGDEWDGNVGARLLYKMAGFTLKSQGLL